MTLRPCVPLHHVRLWAGVWVMLCLGVFSGYSQALHAPWTSLLKRYVNAEGAVNYSLWKQNTKVLDAYLEKLSQTKVSALGKQAQFAYWINAYNAFTIRLILDNHPLKSIRDIPLSEGLESPWDIRFIRIEGRMRTLNEIEHEILRKEFKDARIHFVLVCAALSCPPLRQEAYVSTRLDAQLDAQARRFLNNKEKNRIGSNALALSSIFEWFKDDFTQQGTLVEFIQPYVQTPLSARASVRYLPYDWSLNGY